MEFKIVDVRFPVCQAFNSKMKYPVLCDTVASVDKPGVCYVNGVSCDGWSSGQLDTALVALGARPEPGQPLYSARLQTFGEQRFCVTMTFARARGVVDPLGVFFGMRVTLSLVLNAQRAGVPITTLIITGVASKRGSTFPKLDMVSQISDAFRCVVVRHEDVSAADVWFLHDAQNDVPLPPSRPIVRFPRQVCKLRFILCDPRADVQALLSKCTWGGKDVTISSDPAATFNKRGVCFVNGVSMEGWTDGVWDTQLSALGPPPTATFPLYSAHLSEWDNHRFCVTVTFARSRHDVDALGVFLGTRVMLSLVLDASRRGLGFDTIVFTPFRTTAAKQMSDAFVTVFHQRNIVVDPKQASHPNLIHDAVNGF